MCTDTKWLGLGVGGFSVDDDWVDGSKEKKQTSSSARAPPTEKHDILHSFNAGFPEVGFANPLRLVRELQGVRELVHFMPKCLHTINELIQRKM